MTLAVTAYGISIIRTGESTLAANAWLAAALDVATTTEPVAVATLLTAVVLRVEVDCDTVFEALAVIALACAAAICENQTLTRSR